MKIVIELVSNGWVVTSTTLKKISTTKVFNHKDKEAYMKHVETLSRAIV